MIKITFRGTACVISAIIMLRMLAVIHEKDFLNSAYVTVETHIAGSSASLHRWMELCDFELYPNLKLDTVMSQHGNGQSAMTVFVPYNTLSKTTGQFGIHLLLMILTFIIARLHAFGFAIATHRWRVCVATRIVQLKRRRFCCGSHWAILRKQAVAVMSRQSRLPG